VAGKEGDRARWGEARHSFRVLAGEILAELDASASKKQVYEKHRARLRMSYVTFTRWVRTHQKPRESSDAPLLAHLEASKAADREAASPQASALQDKPAPRKPGSGPLIVRSEKERTFHWDPTEAFDKKFD
jgi:hypothetical protein